MVVDMHEAGVVGQWQPKYKVDFNISNSRPTEDPRMHFMSRGLLLVFKLPKITHENDLLAIVISSPSMHVKKLQSCIPAKKILNFRDFCGPAI